MPTIKDEIREAAFWHETLCLDCGSRQEEPGDCDTCGSPSTINGELALKLLTQIEAEELL